MKDPTCIDCAFYESKKHVDLIAQRERARIRTEIDQLIYDTEDCPLYEGEERLWLLSAYRRVRRLMADETTGSILSPAPEEADREPD